jgi:hypothetical protein
MKKVIIGIVMLTGLALGLTTCGYEKYISARSTPGMKIETASAPPRVSNGPSISRPPDEDASIFSWTAILYLISVVVGIVAFRRNAHA